MRMNRGQSFSEVQGPHAGSLLLAHPRLLDPNFLPDCDFTVGSLDEERFCWRHLKPCDGANTR